MLGDYFSAVYYSMMTVQKKNYKLQSHHQAEYYFEAVFILIM